MKVGDSFKCPHCGADSFLKKESVMDGWVKKGEVLKCASCSAFVADATEPVSTKKQESEAAARLRNFLGAEDPQKIEIKLNDSEKRFCKDCVNLIQHPFVLRCTLDGRAVNPMDDCSKFKVKT